MKENVSCLLILNLRVSFDSLLSVIIVYFLKPDTRVYEWNESVVFFFAQSLKLVSSEQALKELGLNEHQLRFTCRVQLQDPHSDSDTLHRIYTHLRR